MWRIIIEFVLAAVFLVLAVLTAVNPEWIETVFHVDPDGGSGALEWIVVAGFGAIALIAAALGTRSAVLRKRAREA